MVKTRRLKARGRAAPWTYAVVPAVYSLNGDVVHRAATFRAAVDWAVARADREGAWVAIAATGERRLVHFHPDLSRPPLWLAAVIRGGREGVQVRVLAMPDLQRLQTNNRVIAWDGFYSSRQDAVLAVPRLRASLGQ